MASHTLTALFHAQVVKSICFLIVRASWVMNTSHHFHSWRCLGGVVYVVVIIQRTQVKWSKQICCNFPCSEGNLTLVMYALLHVTMAWKTLWEHLECLRGFYFLRNMAWKSFSLVFQSTQCQRALLLTASCCALKGLRGALCRNSHLSFSSHLCCPSRLGVDWNYRPLVIWVLRTLKFYEQSHPENILLKPIFRH